MAEPPSSTPEIELLLSVVSAFCRKTICTTPDIACHRANAVVERNLAANRTLVSPRVLASGKTQTTSDSVSYDWKYFFEAAEYHGVIGIVLAHMKVCKCLTPPNDLVQDLQTVHKRIFRSNMFFVAEMFKLHDLLEARSVPFVCMKGPTLADASYGNVSLRKFFDLDIYVSRENVANVDQILRSEGYVQVQGKGRPDLPLYTMLLPEQEFQKGDIQVDVHWEVQSDLIVPFKEKHIKDNVRSQNLMGRALPVFSPEMQFVLLCANGFKSHWSKLIHLTDVALFLERNDVNWDYVTSLTRDLGCEPLVAVACAVVDSCLGITNPKVGAQHNIKSQALREAIYEYRRGLEILMDPEMSGRAKRLKLSRHLLINPSLKGKIRLVSIGILKPTVSDWRAMPLPPDLAWIYYMTRPFRLAWTAAVRSVSKSALTN